MKKFLLLIITLAVLNLPTFALAECNWQAKSGEFAVAVQQLKDTNPTKYNELAPELTNMNKEVNNLLSQNNTDAVCKLYDEFLNKIK